MKLHNYIKTIYKFKKLDIIGTNLSNIYKFVYNFVILLYI